MNTSKIDKAIWPVAMGVGAAWIVVVSGPPQLDIDRVATGEHWYGPRAHALGLCDDLSTSDDYLDDWRRDTSPIAGEGSLEDIARREADRMESDYNEEALSQIVANQGYQGQ